MTELIKITDNNGQQVVSARDLHSFLGSKKDFSSWIKQRISKYDLVENQDYSLFTQKGEYNKPLIEYALTLDSAKELAMVEGNAKGKQARQYFIECERIAKTSPAKLPTMKELAMEVIKLEEEKERLQIVTELQSKELKEAQPKVQYHDEVLSSTSTINANLIAKELGMSAITLNKILKEKGIQYFQSGAWQLYRQYEAKEYHKYKTFSYTDGNGNTRTSQQMVWTEKGRQFIHQVIKNSQALNK